MFEHKSQCLLPLWPFIKRMALFFVIAGSLVATALLIGVAGYHWIAGYTYMDAFFNASMILTTMGPVGEVKTDAAKVFVAFYALFSGLVFLTVMSVVLAPVVHRFLHTFHVEKE